MKKIFILAMMLNSILAISSEFQTIQGDEAYKLFKSLRGATCTEWNSADFVVYTKYETQKCSDTAAFDAWTCTIQINKKEAKINSFMSAECTRELQ